MTERISPSASIHPQAKIADTVEIGPYCDVGPHVEIEAGTRLLSHVAVRGHVRIGRHNVIHPGCVIGGEPQDVGYREEPTTVEIGDHNILRECVTINRGTSKDAGTTKLGSHCFLMASSHIAHDCLVGDHVIMANGSMLGGHVHVHDYASLSGLVAVHHFASIGSYAFVAGMSRVIQDIPPYMLCEGQPARPRCINSVALRRNDFPSDVMRALSDAHRLIYRARVGLDHARELLQKDGKHLPQVAYLLDFIQHQQDGKFGRAKQVRKKAA